LTPQTKSSYSFNNWKNSKEVPMSRAAFTALLLVGCRAELAFVEIPLPQMSLSTKSIDFGDMEWGETSLKTVYIVNQGELPMGIHAPVIEDEDFEGNFTLAYDPQTIECEDSGEAIDEDAEEEEEEYSTEDGEFVLEPGCQIGIDITYSPTTGGHSYASLPIESFIDDSEESDGTPKFYRDPSNFLQAILIHGRSDLGVGNIVVTPRIVDFGHHWIGESQTSQVMINNVGTGDLILENPYLEEDCHESFSLDLTSLDSDWIVPAGHGTIFQATFEPTELDTASCTVVVPSSDPETGEIEVTLKGNAGVDPTNQAPRIEIVSPSQGYTHNSGQDFIMELSLFDPNQPADTLLCKVKSMVLDGGIYDCSANDESGYVQISIPQDELERGVDTLLATVTDQSELQAFASTTIIYGAPFAESDDDGDGFGDSLSEEYVDCDDSDPEVYPFAAELEDGKDNDCDGGIDEKTGVSDDDGDSVSEEEGDCNDNDANSYPGAPEQPDLKDNDCDGIIDENTSLSDDDNDGFSEVDNDCNDNDPEINPAAVEYCDNIDNNCNNLRDDQEGCIDVETDPKIIGGIQMADRAISVGESTTMTIFVYEADGDDMSFIWQEDSMMSQLGHSSISTPTAQTITWKAPNSLGGNLEGQIFSVYVVVTDANGNQDWVFDEISVYRDAVEQNIIRQDTVPASGCGSSDSAGLLLPLLGLGCMRRRRSAAEK
jgi:hypothetical protein